jgi:hypothetical protein
MTAEEKQCAKEREAVTMPMPRQPTRIDWSPVPLLTYDDDLDGFQYVLPLARARQLTGAIAR